VIGGPRGEGLSLLLSESDYTHSADLLDHLFVIERGGIEEWSPTPRRRNAREEQS
jgi:branched-chain amino acid transport system ATP-binding protein